MTKSLPANPSLENLKKQAKTLLKAWQSGNAEALARLCTSHPQFTHASEEQIKAAKPRLSDCQLVLAREYGLDSWPQLKVAVESANLAQADEFVSIACLCFDDPHYDHRHFHQRAHQMLQQNPALAAATIWSASAAGNVDAVRHFLDESPNLVDRPGPYGWTPLLCACYSRVESIHSTYSTLEVARLLLDRGADSNAFTLKRNADERLDQTARKFTVLTGVFGGGTTGQANEPPHPRWHELAELLLNRGADPADEEALRNNSTDSLSILLRRGLKPDAPTVTKGENEAAQETASMTLMGRALGSAALRGDMEQVKLLLAHGARTNEILNGKSPWQHAMARGHLQIAQLLKQANAPTTRLSDVERFLSFCLAGDEPEARATLKQSPDLVTRAPKNMVQRAVGTKRIEAVRLALDLGFDPNVIDDNAAIHAAGTFAEHEDMLRLLLARGASLKLREPWYDGTGIGWADFFDFRDLRDRLLNEPDICLFDALDFDRLDRIPDILARDPEALERSFAQYLTREPKPEDWQTPLVRMVDRGNTEAVRILLQHGADPTAHHPSGQSLLEVAQNKSHSEIVMLLQDRNTSARTAFGT
jgi:ankyrin repeat protein